MLQVRTARRLSRLVLRVERGDNHITDEHVADAIELLLATRPRLRVEEKISTTA
jgi:hypothetical protein